MPRKPDPSSADKEIVVFWVRRDTQCSECGQDLYKGSLLRLEDEKALCMSCADLDHLVFLGRGDAALTRRASKHSPLRAVVVQWSRTRERYERQGILVTEEALDQAEAECLADADLRERRQTREAHRRASLEQQYVADFAAAIRRQFPSAPKGVEQRIAEHACVKHSGRVGRSADAKEFDLQPIRLAVIAHIRHAHTDYDRLLDQSRDRHEARLAVQGEIELVLAKWEGGVVPQQ